MNYDFIIIGAGYGGMASAALLQKKGYKTLLIEAHKYIGGCASYYKRKDFLFDVGATTFSGVKKKHPVGRLIDDLELQPRLSKLDIGMKIYLGKKEIIRYADKQKWFNEITSHFPQKGILEFWEKVYELEKLSWDFISENKNLPPRSLLDLLSLVKLNNFTKIKMIPNLFRSVESILNSMSIYDEEFIKFIDEQLLITTQNTSKFAPMLTSSMGLSYPSETYYPYGGMYKLGEQIIDKYKSLGGEVLLSEEIISIHKEKNFYLKSKSGNEFSAKGIISNIPIWNMPDITFGKVQKYFTAKSNQYSNAPGAFVMNFVVEGKLNLDTEYFQIHFDEKIPLCDANAVFVSFSKEDDFEKAPKGFHTVTVSTHTNPKNWLNLTKEKYKEQKDFLTKHILNHLQNKLDFLKSKNISMLQAGTPKTYQFYTKRKNGFVGGIPHSLKNNLLLLPSNITPEKNLYMVGDSIFPGQGTPAVIMSAYNLLNRIHR